MAIPPEERPSTAVTGTPRASHDGPGATARKRGASEPPYSPAVLGLARAHGIDLEQVRGSGAGGRVTRSDVEAWIAEHPKQEREAGAVKASVPSGDYEILALSPTRKTIAEHTKRAHTDIPAAWMMVEVDATGLVAEVERSRTNADTTGAVEGSGHTMLVLFTSAVCRALRQHPRLNARWEGNELRRFHAFNISIAVATEHGLMVPVVSDAGDLRIADLATKIDEAVRRARERRLRIDDVSRGTFTVNNTGAFGSIASQPIVNYPQVAIVTMERAMRRPVVLEDGRIEARWMMNVCLSFDHRALDGADVGAFLATLKGEIEGLQENTVRR
jgi:2-oxoisovalerate dehydrogenase E2 component (dihydrolipoyl transacylase)